MDIREHLEVLPVICKKTGLTRRDVIELILRKNYLITTIRNNAGNGRKFDHMWREIYRINNKLFYVL